jgi:hypothetical protein
MRTLKFEGLLMNKLSDILPTTPSNFDVKLFYSNRIIILYKCCREFEIRIRSCISYVKFEGSLTQLEAYIQHSFNIHNNLV